MIEISFLGRGGLGAKTAAYLAASAAFDEGKHIQAFPEFGPEREGAPVFAYTRISEEPIRIHSGIYNPDILVVFDCTLVEELDVCQGLKQGGKVLLNIKNLSPKLRERIGNGFEVWYVDATGISLRLLGKNLPNMAMLGALSRISQIYSMKQLERAFKDELGCKLNHTQLALNLKAMEEAYEQVKKL